MQTNPGTDHHATQEEIDALVLAHHGYARALAYRIAKRLPSHVDPEELAAYAVVGLTEAARRFDSELGVAFTTFSYYRIRGAVYDGLREMSWLPPESRREQKGMELEDALCESGLGEVSPEADAEAVARAFREAARTLGAVFLLTELGDDHGVDPVDETSAADQAEQNDLVRRLRTGLGELDDEARELVRGLYFEGLSMTEVAERLGVNKSTICRAHARVVARLKEYLVT